MVASRRRHTAAIVSLLFVSCFTASVTLLAYQDIIFRQLPLPNANSIVLLGGASAEPGRRWPDLWNQGAFTQLGLFQSRDVRVGGPGHERTVRACLVDAAFFKVMEVPPARGRLLTAEDTAIGAPSVAVVSDSFWKGELGGATDFANIDLTVSGRRFRVIGVMPPALTFPSNTALYLPRPDNPLLLSYSPNRMPGDVSGGSDRVIGRLAPGVTLEMAREMEKAVIHDLQASNHNPHNAITARVNVRRLQDVITFGVTGQFALLAIAGCCVAVVALGSLLLLSGARTSMLRKDIAIRFALGATVRSLVVRELTWWLALSVPVLFGVLAAVSIFLRLVRQSAVALVPRLDELSLHPYQAAYIGAAVVAVAMFLAIPYFLACLKNKAISDVLNRSAFHSGLMLKPALGRTISLIQLSIAVALTTATVCVCLNYLHLSMAPPGTDPTNVFVRDLTPSPFFGALASASASKESASPSRPASAADPLQWTTSGRNKEDMLARGEALNQAAFFAVATALHEPGVTSAGLMDPEPYAPGAGSEIAFQTAPGADGQRTQIYRVYGSIPQTLGMSLQSGRWFNEEDQRDTSQVAVVSHQLATDFYDGAAIGRQIWLNNELRTIIGVVSDISAGYGEPTEPATYVPFDAAHAAQAAEYALLVKMIAPRQRPGDYTPPAVSSVLQVGDWSSMASVMSDDGATDRAGAVVVGWFSFLVLILAAASAYAILWTLTVQREREMAIRICLGAQPRTLAGRTIVGAATLAAAAGFVGYALALALQKVLWSKIYGFPVFSASSFCVSMLVISAAAVLSSFGPARFITRLYPAEVLKEN